MKQNTDSVEKTLSAGNGLLRLQPAWVARDFLPPGKRLGLPEREYDVGERGAICERWIGSTTRADNRVGPPDEGLSYIAHDGLRMTLREAVEVAGDLIMGADYARTHAGLGRLAPAFPHPPAPGGHVKARKNFEGRGLLFPRWSRHGAAS